MHETIETCLIGWKYQKSHPNIQKVLLNPHVTKTVKLVFSSFSPLFSPFMPSQPGTPSSQLKYPTFPKYQSLLQAINSPKGPSSIVLYSLSLSSWKLIPQNLFLNKQVLHTQHINKELSSGDGGEEKILSPTYLVSLPSFPPGSLWKSLKEPQ